MVGLILVIILQDGAADFAARAQGRVDEIQSQWRARQPQYTGGAYAENPQVEAPYSSGRLQSRFVADGLNMLNFARFVAGLPAVELDEARQEAAQWGAVVSAANGRISHEPDRPPGMGEREFQAGRAVAGSSNLAMGYHTLHAAVEGYLDDREVETLGHRRWCLNYAMARTAFGFAHEFSNMWSFDQSRPDPNGWTLAAWPSDRVFPLRFAHPGLVWSLHLNPGIYRYPTGKLRVALRRLNDGLVVQPQATALESGYGNQICIKFTPGREFKYADGEVYEVTVTGITNLRGAAMPITYQTLISAAATR